MDRRHVRAPRVSLGAQPNGLMDTPLLGTLEQRPPVAPPRRPDRSVSDEVSPFAADFQRALKPLRRTCLLGKTSASVYIEGRISSAMQKQRDAS